ncbi:MAG: hypothetical protein KGI71_05590, partial [Patescibacteria group bacterium]|nr:hypothetical protein [Patescibacteria group bacterium]
MTPDFTFDAATHTYRIGGHVVPSVTQVIRSCAPGWMADEWYLERGKAVHEAIRLSISGRLDWTELDPRIEGR